PAAASRDMYVGRAWASLDGGLAVGVPGEIAGLGRAHREHGRLPWRQVVNVARDLAARGPVVTGKFHALVEDTRAMIARYPALAATLDALAREGPAVFYRGRMARAMVRAVREAGGVLTEADLAAYRPVAREPVVGRYRGYDLYSMPPPSSGGAVLIETLNIL